MKTEYSLASGSTAAIESAPPTEDAQPTILFVPGYTGSKEDFLPLLRPLATAGYRSVAIDQRGQYESAWAKDEDGYSIDSLAADVCDLAGQLRPVAASLHLVGHSFGGLVTRAAVLAEPILFGTFTLMDSGPTRARPCWPSRACKDCGRSWQRGPRRTRRSSIPHQHCGNS